LEVYFDGASLPAETKLARENERWREVVRLLYVTLTRARESLVLPWGEAFGGARKDRASFANLWGGNESGRILSGLEDTLGRRHQEADGESDANEATGEVKARAEEEWLWRGSGNAAPALPRRRLPHQLAIKPDLTRMFRHDSGVDGVAPLGGEEAIDYGLWWHETLEFFPWDSAPEELKAYAARRLAVAETLGFAERGRVEWGRWLQSPVRALLGDARWSRQAEMGVFAPLEAEAWVDGVIDLVLHDPVAEEVWVVDWKTNRQRAKESVAEMSDRLAKEYAPQLGAYAACLAPEFPEANLTTWIYASATGGWIKVLQPE
jgi:ATP-dependent exoDNAse (exonuclease V) beta subunit